MPSIKRIHAGQQPPGGSGTIIVRRTRRGPRKVTTNGGTIIYEVGLTGHAQAAVDAASEEASRLGVDTIYVQDGIY